VISTTLYQLRCPLRASMQQTRFLSLNKTTESCRASNTSTPVTGTCGAAEVSQNIRVAVCEVPRISQRYTLIGSASSLNVRLPLHPKERSRPPVLPAWSSGFPVPATTYLWNCSLFSIAILPFARAYCIFTTVAIPQTNITLHRARSTTACFLRSQAS